MRGGDAKQESMFSYVSPERRVPMDHPWRPVREMVDGILKEMSPRFGRLYSNVGRSSIATERLLRALLLQADRTAERDAALLMASEIPGTKLVTLGGDKNYDTQDFGGTVREMKFTPHVARNTKNRSSAIDRRTTRHAGYESSQQKRKRVKQSFGWIKMIGLLKKVKLPGLAKVSWWFTFAGAAYNLIRLRRLRAEAVA